ncbi:MAG: DUF2892 domain-containing protein [Sulfobacillus sp.]|nr:DUF2892 domain-containing protein [Sulfobacillus sp.]
MIGLVLGYGAFNHWGGSVGTWIFGILAVVAIITGITGFCGLYRLFGISTCPVPPKKS